MAITPNIYSYTAEKILPETAISALQDSDPYPECYLTITFFDDVAGKKLSPVITSNRMSKLFLCINVLQPSGAESLIQALHNVRVWSYVSVNKIDHRYSKLLLDALSQNEHFKSLGHEISINREMIQGIQWSVDRLIEHEKEAQALRQANIERLDQMVEAQKASAGEYQDVPETDLSWEVLLQKRIDKVKMEIAKLDTIDTKSLSNEDWIVHDQKHISLTEKLAKILRQV